MGLLTPQAMEYLGLLGQSMLGGQSPNAGVNISQAMMFADQDMRKQAALKARLDEERQQAQMRDMQMQQMQQAQAAAQAQEEARSRVMGQRPDLADLYTVAPQEAIRRAFPEPVKPKITFAPDGTAVDMNAVQPGQNFAKKPDWQNPEYQQFQMNRARAGAPRVDVKYGGSMASELGKGTAGVLSSGRDKAESAVESIKQGHQILQTLDAGTSYVGPGASIKLKAAQIAPMLGFKPDEAGLRNTRELIVGLANQTLNSRGLLKGQGQITEYEQKTLQKAKSGEIDDMTADEIRALVRVNERASRAQIANHARLVGALGKNPQYSEALPFFQIDMPPDYSPTKAAPAGGLTLEDVEAEILRRRGNNGRP